eukprot:TRINITY_DN4683_c0_g1_i1.p1 TRINITY_DN4683_c0_g1~~TRINITY_DN4683_c0_g1_i1.p1  ORF type:complete len:180 (-),score=21.88 TRINITY_DN4683_c0_g1_i1:71-610(-)
MDESFAPKGRLQSVIQYFWLRSGGLHNPPEIRHKAIGLQFILLPILSLLSSLYPYWYQTLPAPLAIPLNALLFLALAHYITAFFLSLRDNVPRFVKTKNNVGLFLFTLVFFEASVMAALFWFLYLIFWFSSTTLCAGVLCSGLIGGVFGWVNVLAGVTLVVLLRNKRTLGITLSDAFGM